MSAVHTYDAYLVFVSREEEKRRNWYLILFCVERILLDTALGRFRVYEQFTGRVDSNYLIDI